MAHPLFPSIGFGLGLRAPHYDTVLEKRPGDVDFFEIISENFMDAHQGYRDFLAKLRQDYAFVMHGVSLSLGSPDPLNREYLKKLKALADFLQPAWISDHVCWTGVHGKNTHDLLPLPYTEEALAHMVSRIQQVQDALGRRILLENPSSYVAFATSEMPESEFIARMAEEADCAILLDVNNVYVSAYNHGFDAGEYICALPRQRIAQIHLAGHRDYGTHIIDTHDAAVCDGVWALYAQALSHAGMVSTMVEWDDAIPPFEVLVAELGKARAVAVAEKRAA
ncbi:MAG: DUF692 domain-containing protein [Rickettsiales bacterium]|nr:DUF692 domain-containing protein [Rickettsiales bacterium]